MEQVTNPSAAHVCIETCEGVTCVLAFDSGNHVSAFGVARQFTKQTGGLVGQIIVQPSRGDCTEYSLTSGNCNDLFAEHPIDSYWATLTRIVIVHPATADANTTSGEVSIHDVVRFVGNRNLDASLRYTVVRTVRLFKRHQLNGDYCRFAQLDSGVSLGVFWTIFSMRVSKEGDRHAMLKFLDDFLCDPNKDIADFDSEVLVPSAAYFHIHDITDFT